MRDNSVISIRNGVIASLIAGGILAIVFPPAKEYIVTIFFPWLWLGVLWCWEAFTRSYSLPGWAWLIVFSFSIAGIMAILYAFVPNKEPEYRSYVEDHLYGAKWRWQWEGDDISNLWCYCPRCDADLEHSEKIHKTDFLCENCAHSVVATIQKGGKDYALGVVEREVHRRIRTGEYKERLAQ